MRNMGGQGNLRGIEKKSSYAIIAVGAANEFKMEEERVITVQQDANNEKEDPNCHEISRLSREIENLQRKLEQKDAELETLSRQLAEANELQSTYLGMAAHELRGTLASIRMAALVLLGPETSLPEVESRSFLEDIAKQANYIWEVMDILLDVTQFELGKLHIEPKTVHVHSFLENLVKRQNQLSAAKNTRVVLEAVDTGIVRADPIRLQQVIDNLISNAVKYSPRGSTVSIRAEQMPLVWRISVRDEGPGISKQNQQRIFRKFVRLDVKPTGGEPSVGLGLAISRRIVEAHEGQIGVESEPGQGATFWFTLPAGPLNLPD